MKFVNSLLAKTKVSDAFPKSDDLLIIPSTDSPVTAFQKILERNLLSAPVLDVETKQYTGFLDTRDLVSFAVYIIDNQKTEVTNSLDEMIEHGLAMFSYPVSGGGYSHIDSVSVTYLSRRNKLEPINPHQTLLSVASILGSGVHRVPVMSDSGEMLSIISQSALIKWIFENCGDHTIHCPQPIKSIGSSPVLSVPSNATALDVFKLLDSSKRSGVAVVDTNTSVLIGNTSASDLKLFIKNPLLSNLNMKIIDFLNQIRRESINERTPVFNCKECDSFVLVLQKLIGTRAHRIFVTDDKQLPTAVISITDCLKAFIQAT